MSYEEIVARIAKEDKKWRERLSDMKEYFAIYQLKMDEDLHFHRFTGTSLLEKDNLEIQPKSKYDLMYAGSMLELSKQENFKDLMDMLDYIFEVFNIDKPEDFKGHSLSVSDVIVLNDGVETKAFYVDDIGFIEIENF